MRSTFSRTFTTVVILLLAVLLLTGISFQLLVEDYLEKEAVAKLEENGKVVAELVEFSATGDTLSSRDFNIALSMVASVSDMDTVICDASGRLLICADAPFGCEHTGMMLGNEYLRRVFAEDGCVDKGSIEGLYEDERYVVSFPVRNSATGQNLGIVIASSPISHSTAVLKKISEIFLFVAILVVLVAVVVATVFVRRQSMPLRTIARTARDFGHGQLDARVALEGNHTEEVQELTLAFNNMASSLQKSEYQRQEFVANVSHELKTPMTTIAGYVDGILDGTIPQEKHRHYLQIVSGETKRLNRLVRSMLDISRLQDQEGIPEEQRSRFDISECAGQTLLNFEKKLLDKEVDVQVELPEHPVYVMANRDYITQVVYNLLDNAVKFCPQGGLLELKIREGGNKAYISVANEGETIPPEELPLVFDRFHKLDKSRSQNRDGWGLGLYIVKTIVCSHGENISVTSREGLTTFTFTLPLVN